MKHYALIGRRLGHSWSQQWFEGRFRRLGLEGHTYAPHEMENLDGLRQWMEKERIAGFNVTVPYKQAILPLLDGLDPVAREIGAVNCVTVEQGLLVGHNTDAPAFLSTISDLPPTSAVILGTGGAAQAVAWALRQLGGKHIFVSRNPHGDNQIGYRDLPHTPCSVLINATPVGMHPDVDRSPLPADFEFPDRNFQLVYDLIYNPSPTLLLRQAAAHGAKTQDGLAMLHRQAELSWELWNGKQKKED